MVQDKRAGYCINYNNHNHQMVCLCECVNAISSAALRAV